MRQTLVKDGVQDRLSNLIGNGVSSYSVQASMLEDMQRICKAVVGNSTYGRVMAGMNISPGSTVTVTAGYGITVGGKLIVFGASYKLTGMPTTGTYQVYAKYVLADRGNNDGGKTLNFTNSAAQSVINDQIGARGEISVDTEVLSYNTGDIITVDEDTLYLGTVTYQTFNGVSAPIVLRQSNDNDTIEYTVSRSLTSVSLWTAASGTTALNTNFTNDTIMLLPYGKKRIKSLDVFVRDAMTNTPHTGTTAPSYQIQIALQCFQSGGAAYGDSLFNTSLPECVSGRTFNHYDVDQIVDDAMVGIYLTQAVTTADFTAASGECDISCIIEKLT
jgi:hypothetical protein